MKSSLTPRGLEWLEPEAFVAGSCPMLLPRGKHGVFVSGSGLQNYTLLLLNLQKRQLAQFVPGTIHQSMGPNVLGSE